MKVAFPKLYASLYILGTASLCYSQQTREEILAKTYLGHGSEFIQADEPAEVLSAYLTLFAHGNIERLDPSTNEFKEALASWRQLVSANPDSVHALAGLAKLEMLEAPNNGVSAFSAVEHLTSAVEIALKLSEYVMSINWQKLLSRAII